MKSVWMRLLSAVLSCVATLAFAAGPDKPAVPFVAKPFFPTVDLPDRESRGQRAIDLLGNRLPEVASYYRKSPDQLRDLLLRDHRVRIDRGGRMFVVDELEAPLAAPSAAEDSVVTGTLLPLDQTFLLHSRPGANRTIYLNFRGATLTGTRWNRNGTTIVAKPFDLDGVPNTFNTAELQRIQGIWQRVAEDFAPFDVDVTTEEPPADRLNRAGPSDLVFGTTALITESTGVFSCSCGGVAYVGIFDETDSSYKPALVFYDKLSRSEKYIAEAISHEVGHNIGLSHDGTSTVGYYTGHGSGATGWAPIMGVGYYQPLVQWSKGEYTGANNLEDDFAVAQANGLPLRADDHGDTLATATLLSPLLENGIPTVRIQGVIERSSDADVFAFSAGAGTVNVVLSPAARAANLDLLISLRNSAGTVLASANPATALNASLTATVPASGTYYVTVEGAGSGNPKQTGYSDYGSVGNYALAANFQAPGNVAPTAVISGSNFSGTAPLTVTLSGASSTDRDGSIAAYDWTFGDGLTGSGVTTSHTYNTPGTYTIELRVTDEGGLSGTTTRTVTVGAPPVAMSVNAITLTRTVRNGQATATASVRIVTASGAVVSNATVTGTWSGVVSGNASRTTASNGTAQFTSAATRATTGSFVFTVTGVTRSGYQYQPAQNVETRDSIAVR